MTTTPKPETDGAEDMPEIDMLLKLVALGDARAYSDIKHRWGNVASETARLREQVKELHGLVLALLDNDPDDMAADGVTVLDVWRKSARDLMEKTNA